MPVTSMLQSHALNLITLLTSVHVHAFHRFPFFINGLAPASVPHSGNCCAYFSCAHVRAMSRSVCNSAWRDCHCDHVLDGLRFFMSFSSSFSFLSLSLVFFSLFFFFPFSRCSVNLLQSAADTALSTSLCCRDVQTL